MASSPELIEELQKELICSICRDYFTNPMTIECGHSFCHGCLRSWQEASASFSCPECRGVSQLRDFKANVRLGKLAAIAKKLRPHCLQYPEEHGECEVHQKVYKLLCEDDQSPVCVSCSQSQKHEAHKLCHIDKAAENFKQKLQETVTNLWRKTDNIVQQTANDKIKFAQDMKGVLKRNTFVLHKETEPFHICVTSLPISGVMEWIFNFKVNITLDCNAADPGLIISEDLKSVKYGGVQKEALDNDFAQVFGTQCFTSGRYYCEVEVPNNAIWGVGICKKSKESQDFFVLRTVQVYNSYHLYGTAQYNLYSQVHIKYCQVSVPNLKVGIFLDYEHGEISFYHVKNKYLIYTFPITSFSGPLMPFFYLSEKVLTNDCSLTVYP
ncbi:probable E3 ubiquitin-protein ligase TRIML1 [Vombatus ursinus]|uniref:probable E3 ubiquitin-protein ligase TRIML1 n=1 Tax=Vombatus ursinus TaxID=29139 RepID=UPI000FFDA82B|nr:probable E3 ubiquitin-protein ligase TRIML1 [Vombatus ursinus]XP_027732816.1 probable E3 ubiquitin-protein ligase TRIML1 [Vombatus ursinus]